MSFAERERRVLKSRRANSSFDKTSFATNSAKILGGQLPPYPPSSDSPLSIDSKQRKKGASLISTLSCWSVRSFDLFGPPNFVCSSRAVGRYENRGEGGITW